MRMKHTPIERMIQTKATVNMICHLGLLFCTVTFSSVFAFQSLHTEESARSSAGKTVIHLAPYFGEPESRLFPDTSHGQSTVIGVRVGIEENNHVQRYVGQSHTIQASSFARSGDTSRHTYAGRKSSPPHQCVLTYAINESRAYILNYPSLHARVMIHVVHQTFNNGVAHDVGTHAFLSFPFFYFYPPPTKDNQVHLIT